MKHPAEPFYFSSSTGELFGLYYAPVGIQRGEGVVICNPLPQEMMRSSQALSQLARQLADMGLAVLRFDYFGTGDSDGASQLVSLRIWESNIKTAISALKKKSGVSRITLCGLRIGARLALHISEEIGVKQLLLWDPIADGQHYAQRMEASHRLMLHRIPYEAPLPQSLQTKDQCWGFPWSQAFREDLMGLKPEAIRSACKKIHLIQSIQDPLWQSPLQSLTRHGAEISQQVIGQDLHWDDDRYMKIGCFPTLHLRRLCAALEEG